MSDVLDRKARFRLNFKAGNWTLDKSYFAKNDGGEKWRTDSYHPRLSNALKYLLDRLMGEGYETKGLTAMRERLAEAEARVVEMGERIEMGEAPEVETL